jgi:hypothetical protein
MDFIYESEKDILIVYWDLLDIMVDGKLVRMKEFGIPDHIYKQLSPNGLLEVKKHKMNRLKN